MTRIYKLIRQHSTKSFVREQAATKSEHNLSVTYFILGVCMEYYKAERGEINSMGGVRRLGKET